MLCILCMPAAQAASPVEPRHDVEQRDNVVPFRRYALPPNLTVTFDLSSIWLDEPNGGGVTTRCQLPMRTTRMEVELWSDSSSWTNTLMTGFPGTYTFVRQ